MKDRRLIFLAASCAAYLALWLVVPHINAPKHPLVLFIVTAAFMFAQVSVPRWFASLTARPVRAVVVIVLAGAAWLAVVFVVTAPYTRYESKELGSVPIRMRRSPPPASIQIPIRERIEDPKPGQESVRMKKVVAVRRPADLNFKLYAFDLVAGRARAITSLLMIVAASAFGYLVSFILRDPNIVLPVAGLSAYIDVWTVLVGPTSRAIEKAPHVVRSVSAAMPTPGSASALGGAEPISFVGPADFIFLAIFFGAMYRLRMEPRRAFWILFPLLTLGMAAVLGSRFLPFLGGLLSPGLPALILICFAVIVANFRHFRLKREEYIAMGIAAILLIAAIFVITPMMSRER